MAQSIAMYYQQFKYTSVIHLHTFKCQKCYFADNSVYHKCSLVLYWPIERTKSGDTTPGKSEPWSDGNEEVFSIP